MREAKQAPTQDVVARHREVMRLLMANYRLLYAMEGRAWPPEWADLGLPVQVQL
jgi:hypothetical protein